MTDTIHGWDPAAVRHHCERRGLSGWAAVADVAAQLAAPIVLERDEARSDVATWQREAQRLGRGRSNYEQMWEESRAALAEVLGMALESDIDDRDRLREIAIAAGLRCGACDGEGEIDLGDPARSDAAIERVAGCQACSGVGWALPVPGGEGCPSRCAPGLCDDCDEDIAY